MQRLGHRVDMPASSSVSPLALYLTGEGLQRGSFSSFSRIPLWLVEGLRQCFLLREVLGYTSSHSSASHLFPPHQRTALVVLFL